MEFFDKKFQQPYFEIPTLDGVPFNQIGKEDNVTLCWRFSEIEVKEIVRECGGDISLRLDGINFNFMKKCWNTLKGDVMGMLHEF